LEKNRRWTITKRYRSRRIQKRQVGKKGGRPHIKKGEGGSGGEGGRTAVILYSFRRNIVLTFGTTGKRKEKRERLGAKPSRRRGYDIRNNEGIPKTYKDDGKGLQLKLGMGLGGELRASEVKRGPNYWGGKKGT